MISGSPEARLERPVPIHHPNTRKRDDMNIIITGAAGFVGRYLADYFMGLGHTVTGIDLIPFKDLPASLRFVQADTTQPGDWQAVLRNADAVINLAGKTIFHRWNDAYKQAIYDTRVLTTRNLTAGLPENRPITFISTSAAGFYGDRGEEILDESKPPGGDFLARVCIDWEKAAFAAREKGCRVVAARFGVVLGPNGGALSKMVPAYRLFVGCPIGDGRQWFPWIHLEDLADAMSFVLAHETVEGPLNFCAPNPVRNREFAGALAALLNRPLFLRAPAWLLKLVAGEVGAVVLSSQRAVPSALLAQGFTFRHPNVTDAIRASL